MGGTVKVFHSLKDYNVHNPIILIPGNCPKMAKILGTCTCLIVCIIC